MGFCTGCCNLHISYTSVILEVYILEYGFYMSAMTQAKVYDKIEQQSCNN